MATKIISTLNLLILVALLAALSSSSMTDARPLPNPNLNPSALSLAARLKLEGGDQSSNCWDSLFQLQACTGEVIMFFLNGETYLGPACCQAIRVIEKDCWPNIIGSLGFTAQESDILQGYCDHEAVHSPPSSPSLQPENIVP